MLTGSNKLGEGEASRPLASTYVKWPCKAKTWIICNTAWPGNHIKCVVREFDIEKTWIHYHIFVNSKHDYVISKHEFVNSKTQLQLYEHKYIIFQKHVLKSNIENRKSKIETRKSKKWTSNFMNRKSKIVIRNRKRKTEHRKSKI